MQIIGGRGGTYVAGGIGGRCRVAVRAVCEASSGVAPGAAAVGSYHGDRGAVVVNGNGAAGLCRAGEGRRRIVGEAAAGHVPYDGTDMVVSPGDGRCARRRGVD